MALAIFGISNSGLNLAVTLFVLMIVVVWFALIVYTYFDARRRISDPFLIACATVGSFFPYIGTAVYAIVRPPEFLEDAHERELEIRAAELRVRQLTEASCPKCEYPVEKSFLRCPQCQSRLKDPCRNCGKPVDPRWALCPYCETAIAERPRRRRSPGEGGGERSSAGAEGRAKQREARPKREKEQQPKRRSAAQPEEAPVSEQDAEVSRPKRTQRSPAREPDADPRKA